MLRLLATAVLFLAGSAQAAPLGAVPAALHLDAPTRLSLGVNASALALAAEPPPAEQPPGGNLDFDLLGTPAQTTTPVQEQHQLHLAKVRRAMLGIHQAAGLSTLALLAATVVIGQLNYSDRFSSQAPGTARFEQAHAAVAFSALGGFAATGLLGLLAPVPYDEPRHFDTITVHKIFMGAATLGMTSEMGLGIYAASHEGVGDQRSIAQAHQVIGYTTLALMAAGAVTLLFQ
jgi:hypothetical protein